jgi:hypothetical protein
MSGDHERIMRLWEDKRGGRAPDDLSDILPVQMGQWTEELNVHWFEKKTGFHVKQRGLECAHEGIPYLYCTLDGIAVIDSVDHVLEC